MNQHRPPNEINSSPSFFSTKEKFLLFPSQNYFCIRLKEPTIRPAQMFLVFTEEKNFKQRISYKYRQKPISYTSVKKYNDSFQICSGNGCAIFYNIKHQSAFICEEFLFFSFLYHFFILNQFYFSLLSWQYLTKKIFRNFCICQNILQFIKVFSRLPEII